MKSLHPIIVIFGLISCKSPDYAGHYSMRNSNKNYLALKNDGTFEFVDLIPYNSNYNDGNCFATAGKWIVSKNKLILNSYTDSTGGNEPKIIEIKDDLTPVDTGIWLEQKFPLSHSTFTFYDIQGDTIEILGGSAPDGSNISKLHTSMKFLSWPTLPDISDYNYKNISDTMEFDLFGYPNYKFIRADRIRRIVKIRVYPEKPPGIFANRTFIIGRKRIRNEEIKLVKEK